MNIQWPQALYPYTLCLKETWNFPYSLPSSPMKWKIAMVNLEIVNKE